MKNWKNPEEDKGLLFFAQRMEELTFEYSLDSYKTPTTNPPYLVREALDLLKSQKRHGYESKAYLYLIKELEARITGNPVVAALTCLDNSTYLSNNKSKLTDVIDAYSILRREIEPRTYALKCMELLSKAINTDKGSIR